MDHLYIIVDIDNWLLVRAGKKFQHYCYKFELTHIISDLAISYCYPGLICLFPFELFYFFTKVCLLPFQLEKNIPSPFCTTFPLEHFRLSGFSHSSLELSKIVGLDILCILLKGLLASEA